MGRGYEWFDGLKVGLAFGFVSGATVCFGVMLILLFE